MLLANLCTSRTWPSELPKAQPSYIGHLPSRFLTLNLSLQHLFDSAVSWGERVGYLKRDLCSSLWQSKETSQLNLSTSLLWSQTTSYSEDRCFKLCKRWNTISVWWWESSSFDDFLQQKHDSRWNQLSHLWQEIASYYSMLWTLMTWAEMHWTTHSDVHRSSDFKDFYEK